MALQACHQKPNCPHGSSECCEKVIPSCTSLHLSDQSFHSTKFRHTQVFTYYAPGIYMNKGKWIRHKTTWQKTERGTNIWCLTKLENGLQCTSVGSPLPPWWPAVTLTFDLLKLIRSSVGASEYSRSVLSKLLEAFNEILWQQYLSGRMSEHNAFTLTLLGGKYWRLWVPWDVFFMKYAFVKNRFQNNIQHPKLWH